MLCPDKLCVIEEHMSHAPNSLMWEFRILPQVSSVKSCFAKTRIFQVSAQKLLEHMLNEDRLRRRREREKVMPRLAFAHPAMQWTPLVVHGRPNIEKVFVNKITVSSKWFLPMQLLAQILVPISRPCTVSFFSSCLNAPCAWNVRWLVSAYMYTTHLTNIPVWQLC